MGGEDIQEEAVLAAVKPLTSSAGYTGSTESAAPANATRASSSEASDRIEILFHQHNQRVFRTAYRVTGSAADAEDVLQMVFLRMTRGQETAGATENSEAYFSRAAINASLDLLRSRKRSRVVAIDDVENEASVVPGVSK